MALSRRQSLKIIAAIAAFPTAARGAAPLDTHAVKLVVLDVGGTIIQDHGEVPQAMQSALAKRGVKVSLAEINDWRGASKREMVRHFVELRTKPDAARTALIESIYGDFSAQVNEAYAKVQPIAGAENAIRAMKKRGIIYLAPLDRDAIGRPHSVSSLFRFLRRRTVPLRTRLV